MSRILHHDDLGLRQQGFHDIDGAHVQYAVELAPDDQDGLLDIAEQRLQRYATLVPERGEDVAIESGILESLLPQDVPCGPWNKEWLVGSKRQQPVEVVGRAQNQRIFTAADSENHLRGVRSIDAAVVQQEERATCSGCVCV